MKKKILSLGMILTLVAALVMPMAALAANIPTVSDTLSTYVKNTAADHTIGWTQVTTLAASGTFTITFHNDFTMTGVAFGDIDFKIDTAEQTLAAGPSGATTGVTLTGQVLTFVLGSVPIAATNVVEIQIGLNADGGDTQITNPTTAGNKTITVASTPDSGTVVVGITSTVTATGTFSNNNLPSITSVELWNAAGTLAQVTAMTPGVEYDARVKVTDADGLTDLTTIIVKIYYDNDTEGTTLTEYNGKNAATQTVAVFTWTQSSGLFTMTAMEGTTWAVGTGVPGTADSGTAFQFKFTVGKVATEASGGLADDWQIGAKVTDSVAQTAWATDADGSTMSWYGEVTVPTATVAWGLVNPGMDWAEDGSSEEAVGQTITYISNGAYDEKVKSSATWTGDPSGTATLSAAAGNANEFALKADDTGTLSTAVVVDTTGVAIDETGVLTVEAGVDNAENALWLKLNASFTKALYSGTITYIIANGS